MSPYWLIPAFVAGCWFGAIAMGVLAANRHSEPTPHADRPTR